MMQHGSLMPFDTPVAPGGYAWWYLDALSDDGNHGITLIAFVGSVFSPYYAWASRHGHRLADPLDHCAVNVALYARPGTSAPTGWAMTERGSESVQRSPSTLSIGPSALQWQGDVLTVTLNEITLPWGRRVSGVVRLHPCAVLSQSYALDAAGHHHWCPMAPCARVEVALDQPGLRWSGAGYLDANRGERPLAQDFSGWHWSRAALTRQRSAVLYDVARCDGSQQSLALVFDAQGRVQNVPPPPGVDLPTTRWRLPRSTRSEAPAQTQLLQTLEDGPFYARSVIQTQLLGETATALHESLSLRRWRRPVVQAMLPFRMPRRG